MAGLGESEGSKDRKPWTLPMMLENRDNWNLAADVGVLDYLQKFGNDLLNEAENTLQLLDSFEADLNKTCVEASNVSTKFLSLADSQFVENRVNDDEDTLHNANSVVNNTSVINEQEATDQIKEAINNGLNVLKTKFETVQVANSDSEDDDSGPTGIVYRPINPFSYRPLPHIIGSVEFLKDPTVGLEELPSDEEESVEESVSSESKGLSEENDESELESDRPDTLPVSSEAHDDELTDILYKQPISSSFADHLAKRLEDMDNERKVKPQPSKPTRNMFSTTPPPLDDAYDDEFGSSEDLIFGNRNSRKPFDEDLFAPKSKSSLWDDEDSAQRVTSDVNERRKAAMSDFEKELSRNLEKRIVHDDDYNDFLSPSPPPLDKQITDSYDDIRYASDYPKRNNQSLFDDDDVPSKSNESKHMPSSSRSDAYDHYQGRKDSAGEITKIRDDDDGFNDDGFSDSMFKAGNPHEKSKSSSRSSSVKMSESFQDDNVSIKSNRSGGLFDDVAANTSKKNAIKKNMDDLFSDLNYQNEASEDDDDLFSNYLKTDKRKNDNLGKPSNSVSTGSNITKTNKVVDDLFGDFDNDDLFSKLSVSKPVEPNISSTKEPSVKKESKVIGSSSVTKKLTSSLFDDDDDEEQDVFASENLFSKVKSNKPNKLNNTKTSETVVNKKKSSGLFDDEDDSDLFGSSAKNDFSSDLFSSVPKTNEARKVVVSKNDVNKIPFSNNVIEDNLFTEPSKDIGTSKRDMVPDVKKDNQNNLSDGIGSQDIQPDVPSINPDKSSVKTASIKQISLFTDSENDSAKEKTDVFDDSPLFNDTTAVKVISKESQIRGNVENEGEDLFRPKNNLDKVLKDESSSIEGPDFIKGVTASSNEIIKELPNHAQMEPNDKSVSITSQGLFDVDKSLPKTPPISKKPDVPVKPRQDKPEPPKSLTIRPPISTPDPFVQSDNKVSSIIQSLDVPDGGMISSEKSSASSDKSTSPRVPGKLNIDKALRIDPKALLPGARPTSFKKPTPESKDELLSPSLDEVPKVPVMPEEPVTNTASNSEPVLHSIVKDRAKIQVKRRPQTRKARREAVRQSMIEADGDETDNSSSITTHSGIEKSTASSLFDQPSSVLSPSTDEEDLFGVPPLDLPADYTKVSTSPGDIFDTPNPTIISPDLKDENTSSVKVVSNEKSDPFETDKFRGLDSRKNVLSETPDEDLFSNVRPVVDTKDLVDRKPLRETDDLFTSVEKESINNLVSSNTELKKESATEKPNIFSNVDGSTDSLNEKRKISSKNINILEDNQDDELFFSKKPSVDQKKQIEVKSTLPEVHKSINKVNIFADLDDGDLFGSTSKVKTRSESKELVKDSAANVICSVFNSGVVNICERLTPPDTDELFPPTDWSVSSNNKEKSKTVTSVPEKMKTDSLFDDNLDDDDQLFTKVITATQKQPEEAIGKSKKNDIKTKTLDNLFTNDDDDEDSSLFGEIKTVKAKESIISNKTKLDYEKSGTSSTKKSSLFDGDDDDEDDDDFFASASNRFKSTTKSEHLLEKSDRTVQSSSKKSNVGSVKKLTAKANESKATTKDEFVDPLSAFADKD